jgi:hypothetical protein
MFKRLYWPILACFVIASATLNLFQMRRIAVLNDQVRRAGVRSGDTVPVGLQVRPITLTHPDGAQVVVEFSHTGGKTLLYVFRPGCSWCVKNADSIRELAMRLRRSHRIIGVSLSGAGLSEYMREHDQGFDLYGIASQDTIEELNLGTTPQVIVIGKDALVERSWSGAFIGAVKYDIEGFFGVKLRANLAGE